MAFIKKHKYDLLVIFAVLVISGGIFAYTSLTRTHGAEVIITVDGKEVMRLDLAADTTVTIGEGEHKNTVTVQNGAVCVSDATCPDHVCTQTGWIEYEGEMIVCLPNKLVVTVVGGADSATDAVTG